MPPDPTLSGLPMPPAALSGDALYDLLMQGIEPELCTDHLPTIAPLIQKESVAKRKLRAARYAAAFQEYERQYALYLTDWLEAYREYKAMTLDMIEASSDDEETERMTSLEQTFDSTAAS